MPPCYRGLETVTFTNQKASAITMGHPTTLYTTLALHALLTNPMFVITHAHKTGYDVIISVQTIVLSIVLSIQRSQMVNSADRMVTPLEGEPHNCHVASNKHLKAHHDLQNQPLSHFSLKFFVDGSCFRGMDGNVTGYVIVAPSQDFTSFITVQALSVS